MIATTNQLETEAETELAEAILDAERHAMDAVRGTPAEPLLDKGRTRREKTRGIAMRRLENAIDELVELSREDTDLAEAAQTAAQAWERARNLRWKLAMSARRVARGEAWRYHSDVLDRADLVQEGMVGLIRAARRYEPNRGVRFSTYARYWVREQLTSAVAGDRLIRLPDSAMKTLRRLRTLLDEEGDDVTPEEVAECLDIDPRRARRLLAVREPMSLEASHDEDSAPMLERVVVEERFPNPETTVERSQHVERLYEALDEALDERSRNVIERRFGLDGDAETLASIAEDYDITPQRVRQIQVAAVDELSDWCANDEPSQAWAS